MMDIESILVELIRNAKNPTSIILGRSQRISLLMSILNKQNIFIDSKVTEALMHGLPGLTFMDLPVKMEGDNLIEVR